MARFPGCISSIAFRALAQACALFAVLLAFAAPALAGSAKLAWNPVANPSLAGYVIHSGPAAGNYTASVDAGNVTTYTVSGLTEGATYHFVVAAYDAGHIEGGLSNDVSTVIAYTVPVASFSASTVSGRAPLTLNFINASTGVITNYAWTFGDGTTSTAANPVKVYSNPGSYTVGLTVTGPGGSNVNTKPNYITVTASSDTTPPSAPGTPTATAIGSTSINLSWPAATDNVAVTGYKLERCQGASCTTFAQIATPTGTAYTNSSLVAGTTYRYRVRATDAAGNLGPYSAIASATTTSGADTTPPSAPTSVTATAVSSAQINLGWTASTDNVGVTGYLVERCPGVGCSTFAQIATPTGTAYTNSSLVAGTTYRYRVRATDAAGNLGPYSAIASATTTSGADTTPPSAPGTPIATATGGTINVSWPAATDNVAVTGYKLERCLGASCTTFIHIATPTGTAYNDSGHAAGMTFRYRVRATDAAGNLGAYSPIVSVTTAAGADTTPPSAPGTPTATAIGSTSINLSWPAATDNVAVTGYKLERCQGASCTTFAQIATPTGTAYTNSSLVAGTTYRYRVRATDAAGNLGPYSAIASATTTSGADTTPPSAPTSVTATAVSSAQINLGWTASTDNVGVTGYLVERCPGVGCSTFAQIATPTATTYNDTGRTANMSYSYRVRARDAVPNLGPYSKTASSTTPTGNGLVAGHAFSEGSGSTTADASGSGLTGTLVGGPTWMGGKNGTALSFNGSTAYVDLGTSAALGFTGSMTLSAWVYETANVVDDGQIIAKSDPTSGWQLKSTPDTGARTFAIAITNIGGGRVQRYSSTVRALNTWYHVAGVYDATARTLDIYVNGTLANGALSGTVPTSQRASTVAANIGRRMGGFNIRGIVDDVRVYGRALGVAEIRADMATPVR